MCYKIFLDTFGPFLFADTDLGSFCFLTTKWTTFEPSIKDARHLTLKIQASSPRKDGIPSIARYLVE
jgi:hypothetical protein